MRILVVGLNYAPDEIGIAKYTSELCENLVRRGHVVKVVCGPPYYPNWRVGAGHSGIRWKTTFENGVYVFRTPLYVPKTPTGFSRVLHLFSFAMAAAPISVWQAVTWKPAFVFAVAPAITSAPVALMAAKASGAGSWLHVQDFEVDAAFNLVKLPGRRRRSLALITERFVMRSFGCVSSISPRMIEALVLKGVDRERTFEFRNWANPDLLHPSASAIADLRAELNLPPDRLIVLYSGSMGAKQGLEVLGAVAELLETLAPKVTLLLCGNGPMRRALEASVKGRSNVQFLDLQPQHRLGTLLGMADIHILPQRTEAADLVLPSKLSGMLASGRPIIAMAEPGTGLAHEVGAAGVLIKAADAQAMAQAIVQLAEAPSLRATMGTAGRAIAERLWSRDAIVNAFEHQALAMPKKGRSPSVGAELATQEARL